MPGVAVVLPPREAFSPEASGAIGLLAHRLARRSARPVTVLGEATAAPFGDVAFVAIQPALLPAPRARRYAASVARDLAWRQPDLVEVHNRPEVALYLAKRLRAPVALVLHNDPHGMRAARSPAERAELRAALAGVATVSAYLRGRLLDGVAAPWRQVAVLPNCIDLSDIPPPRPRAPSILFAGRVVGDKGADTFVRACALALPRLPGWTADMIGADRFGATSPDTPFLRDLRPLAAHAGVTLHGWRPHSRVLAEMSRAAIVVVPSRWAEPFGLTALEAMACGAALLCSPRGGLPEVVGDAAVMIDPDNPDTLADAIVALANDPARRAALSAAGRARAAGFDVTIAVEKLAAIREGFLAAWHRRHPPPI